jgi:hypothetical protein
MGSFLAQIFGERWDSSLTKIHIVLSSVLPFERKIKCDVED